MRNPLLAAIVLITGACAAGGTRNQPRTAETPSSAGPRFGRMVALYEVLDQSTRERVGYVELYGYDNGQQIYWVRDRDRDDKLGYILTNNKGYRYVWHAGQRAEEPEFIGADTISANSRRILGHDQPVDLEEKSLRELARELQAPPPEQGAASDEGSGEE